ncbi:3-deoxy-manno-octulosonate cytidylyltransferase [Facilibium subflavum]|uniref:3-deoxy-manno-octulosonate cytidylyltransferase n=1 Tax=Facilibium subflavum TaxID=2219058 RepID=UPI000E6486F8|nr:3-deoxy-manno-octulosonate cytidylyltransferase [Facilibium subflavum]
MVKKHIIIPARLQSTRLPDKPLIDIAGKPMIAHVYDQAKKCGFDTTIIATDSTKIADAAHSFGADVCMTKTTHASGTERIAEVVDKREIPDDDIIINVQGDEPLLPVDNILQVASLLSQHNDAVMATLCEQIDDAEDIFDPNCVKVVLSDKGYALYFSRAPIPWQRGIFDQKQAQLGQHYRHIGLYAYRAGFLKRYADMQKSPLEVIESLEQLRVLWHNEKIAIAEARQKTPLGVDTYEDLEKIRALFS